MTDADLARWEEAMQDTQPRHTPTVTRENMLSLIAEVRRLRALRAERMAPPTTAFCPTCAAQQYPVPDADWINVANRARRAWGLPPIQRMEPKNA